MPRVYVGKQFQDNALVIQSNFNPAVVNTGVYCTLSAGNPALTFGVSTLPSYLQFCFFAATFYMSGNAGVNGGTIQPQIQLSDGVYRDYGPLITVTAPGFIYSTTINSPVLGAQFNVTGAMTGGSVYLELEVLVG